MLCLAQLPLGFSVGLKVEFCIVSAHICLLSVVGVFAMWVGRCVTMDGCVWLSKAQAAAAAPAAASAAVKGDSHGRVLETNA